MPSESANAAIAKFSTPTDSTSESASEGASPRAFPPANGALSEADSGAASDAAPAQHREAGKSPDAAPTDEAEVRRQLLAEKLADLRARRADKRTREEASRLKAEAAKEKADAEAYAAKWGDVRKDWRKGLAEVGADPAQALEEMVQQAVEHGTPEAQIKRVREEMREELRKELLAEIEPMRAQLKEFEQLKAERDALRTEREAQAAVTEFKTLLRDPKYAVLLEEYPEDDVLQYADALGKLWQTQNRRYSLQELLGGEGGLLDMYEKESAKRAAYRAARAGETNSSHQAAKPRTVNGTEVSNAGIVTNQLASEVSTGTPRLTPRQRAERLASRG